MSSEAPVSDPASRGHVGSGAHEMAKILVVDDEPFIGENLNRILSDEGYEVAVVSTGAEALRRVNKDPVDLVLLDLNLPDVSGLDVLREIKAKDPFLLVIVITGYASVESAVRAIKMGAYDYLKKPFKADVIKLIVRLALETQRLKREVDYLTHRQGENEETLVGESPAFRKVLDLVREVSKHPDTTVLITGESGTGKELIARRVHQWSRRAKRPFLEINCAALPESLLESELFGYEGGAFTGARAGKVGLFEAADGGSIFLDEIGEMDLSLQAKLLRVLEDKKVRRVGGTRLRSIDVRIIAATNKDLSQAVADRSFREDLYYRLHIFPIHLPALRERPEDIEPLTKLFLSRYNQKFGKSFDSVDPEVLEIFRGYPWPGNVRELKNVIERICIMSDGPVLTVDLLPAEILAAAKTPTFRPSGAPLIPPEGLDLEKAVDDFTKKLVERALIQAQGNISLAAKLLKLPRGTFRYKLEKYGIRAGSPSSASP